MAAQTELNERIDSQLRAVRLTAADLPEVAAEWDRLADGERASWSLEWDHLIADYLTDLDECERAGHMTAEQHIDYRDLLGVLEQMLPIIERLNLYRPPVSLDLVVSADAAPARIAAE